MGTPGSEQKFLTPGSTCQPLPTSHPHPLAGPGPAVISMANSSHSFAGHVTTIEGLAGGLSSTVPCVRGADYSGGETFTHQHLLASAEEALPWGPWVPGCPERARQGPAHSKIQVSTLTSSARLRWCRLCERNSRGRSSMASSGSSSILLRRRGSEPRRRPGPAGGKLGAVKLGASAAVGSDSGSDAGGDSQPLPSGAAEARAGISADGLCSL